MKIFSRETAETALGHLKDYKVRYAIASAVVGILGLSATQTDKISDGLLIAATLLSSFL